MGDELFDLRTTAHDVFDPLWMNGALYCRRRDAYRWLADKVGLPVERCHFSQMTRGQLERAIEICARGSRKAVIRHAKKRFKKLSRELSEGMTMNKPPTGRRDAGDR